MLYNFCLVYQGFEALSTNFFCPITPGEREPGYASIERARRTFCASGFLSNIYLLCVQTPLLSTK